MFCTKIFQCLNTINKRQINIIKLFQSSIFDKFNTRSNLKYSQSLIRYKYTGGQVKGQKSSKKIKAIKNKNDDEQEKSDDDGSENINLENDSEYDVLANNAMHVTNNVFNEQRVLVIQPFVKWGPKMSSTKPDLKLQEAEALVKSLPNWSIVLSLKIPLESLNKRTLFGTGKLEEIKNTIKELRATKSNITCIFISKGMLNGAQKRFLEQYYGYPIMDRYSMVIQILRLHAKSTEAKLQVAMAEIPYIWSQLRDSEQVTDKRSIFILSDTQKQMLRSRERKLKIELSNIRTHRELLRNKRKQQNYPIIAVVGYTNAGKTSLIKALTNEQSMQPRNQLFATLDITAHGGLLPCKLEVIYIDTVGFMSDIPTGLLECFIATLEDAMLADIIIHVQDISHENHEEQTKHVEKTLLSLVENSSNSNINILDNIINVGNKMDLINNTNEYEQIENLHLISSTNFTGMKTLLEEIEKKILKITNRIKLIIKVSNGGEEMFWLHKNSAVTSTNVDPNDSQQLLLNVVISEAKLNQFKHYYCS